MRVGKINSVTRKRLNGYGASGQTFATFAVATRSPNLCTVTVSVQPEKRYSERRKKSEKERERTRENERESE